MEASPLRLKNRAKGVNGMKKPIHETLPTVETAANAGRASRMPYRPQPDYSVSPPALPAETCNNLLLRLRFLYGEAQARTWLPELERIIKIHWAHKTPERIEAEKRLDRRERFTEKDMVLITYGDMVAGEGPSPLATLHTVVDTYNLGAINTLHLLPFFPYSSDRGFAVVDFTRVDPKLGTWGDILSMGAGYDLMFDGVLNHCSSSSRMFREFANGNPYYKGFFIAYESPDALSADQRSKIFRPRTTDILTRFDTIEGARWVWTTFSADQIDLNFRNPAVLMRVIEGLLFYVRQGADILRLDAVTYIWAEPGTECVHLPETHEIVKILRDVLDAAAPGVALLTETNVPHVDNISYFGNGYDEAHMVYNFALPPLVLHTFTTEDATALTDWAAGMANPSDAATFFNILDTHDGIGLMGVKGILSREAIDRMIERAKTNGAYISYKMTAARTEEPYEINSTWWSAINGEGGSEALRLQVKRYLASRSISAVIQGVPGLYLHGAIGTANDHDLVRRTGHKRDANRGMIDSAALARELGDPESKISLIRQFGSRMNLTRVRQRAFHPQGPQKILRLSPGVFSVLRSSPERDEHILALVNVSGRQNAVDVSLHDVGIRQPHWRDLLGGRLWRAENDRLCIELEPYDVLWLKPQPA
jgi:sucrose phosphorylase